MAVIRFALVLACFLLSSHSAKSNVEDQLAAVFGSAGNAPSASQPNGQSANTDHEITDPDYWDEDTKFNVSTKQYDTFDFAMLKRLSENNPGNILLSPFNLKTALGILGEAATGVTKNEILTTLNLPGDRYMLREKFSSILQSLTTPSPDYTVELGSRIYVAKDVAPRQKYMAVAHEFYKTDIKNLDFDSPKQSAAEVNAWVAQATKGHIDNLVDEDDIEDASVLFLTTIYFKGKWRHQFPVNQTTPNKFYLNSAKQVQVPMMFQKETFYYYDSPALEAKILRLPYLGNKFAMYVLLPNAVNGLNDLLKKMYAHQLRSELFLLREETVRVTMPKLTFDFQSHLVPVLKELGIRELFEDSASLPGIARGQTLASRFKVSNVVQKAGIEVNEVGSTAYAATEISLVNKFGTDEDEEVDFIVDKPFAFYIEDETQRQILFIGTVRDPQQSKISIAEVPETPAPPTPASNGGQVTTAPQGLKQKQSRAPVHPGKKHD